LLNGGKPGGWIPSVFGGPVFFRFIRKQVRKLLGIEMIAKLAGKQS
jgi:hypothetical protein